MLIWKGSRKKATSAGVCQSQASCWEDFWQVSVFNCGKRWNKQGFISFPAMRRKITPGHKNWEANVHTCVPKQPCHNPSHHKHLNFETWKRESYEQIASAFWILQLRTVGILNATTQNFPAMRRKITPGHKNWEANVHTCVPKQPCHNPSHHKHLNFETWKRESYEQIASAFWILQLRTVGILNATTQNCVSSSSSSSSSVFPAMLDLQSGE